MQKLKVLHKNSLYETVDRINEAAFFAHAIDPSEAESAADWIQSRMGAGIHYHGLFGLTPAEMDSGIFTFTGDRLQSASLRHVMAEETCRALLFLESQGVKTGRSARQSASEELGALIAGPGSKKMGRGFFCCGTCTVAVWRHVNAGGLQAEQPHLPAGIEILKQHRDDQGGWRRFPFYYTLSALIEMEIPTARDELQYAGNRIRRLLKRPQKSTRFALRRMHILQKSLDIIH